MSKLDLTTINANELLVEGSFEIKDFESLKENLSNKLVEYLVPEVNEDNYKLVKKDKQELTKLSKELNDRRILLQKNYMKPFDNLKSQVDELISNIDVVAKELDNGLKEVDNRGKESVLNEIKAYFEVSNPYRDILKFEDLYNSKWLNKTTKMEDVKNEIDATLLRINNDLYMLKTAFGVDKESTRLAYYIYFYVCQRDLSKTIETFNDMKIKLKSLDSLI